MSRNVIDALTQLLEVHPQMLIHNWIGNTIYHFLLNGLQ